MNVEKIKWTLIILSLPLVLHFFSCCRVEKQRITEIKRIEIRSFDHTETLDTINGAFSLFVYFTYQRAHLPFNFSGLYAWSCFPEITNRLLENTLDLFILEEFKYKGIDYPAGTSIKPLDSAYWNVSFESSNEHSYIHYSFESGFYNHIEFKSTHVPIKLEVKTDNGIGLMKTRTVIFKSP